MGPGLRRDCDGLFLPDLLQALRLRAEAYHHRAAICRAAGPSRVPGSARARLAVIDVQDRDEGRRGQHLADRVHPVAGLLARADTARAEPVELVEAGQLD